jgi:YVTN family beta-propeller protein
MKTRLLAAVMTFSLSLACAPEAPGGGGTSAGGSVAISRDDALVYAVDADLDTLFVVKASDPTSVTQVKVGKAPEKVLVAPDETIYVANRFGRSVSVVRKGEATVSATIDVGIEPVGLALSTDGKTLYVVNSASRADLDVGTVMAFDTATRELKWETPVGPEPRAITLLANGKALVTLFKAGDVVMLDAAKGQLEPTSSDLFRELNRSALGIGSAGRSPTPFIGALGAQTRRPRAMEAIMANPTGTQVYVAALLSSDSVLNTRPNKTGIGGGSTGGGPAGGTGGGFPGEPVPPDLRGGSSGYGSPGGCGRTSAVAAPALLTFDEQGKALVDDVQSCAFSIEERPPMLLGSNDPTVPVQGPTAMAADPSGAFLFIANRESNNVSIIPTTGQGTSGINFQKPLPGFSGVEGQQQVVAVGAGPTGVAVSRDGKTAWVFNAFDHSLSKLEGSNGATVRNTLLVQLGGDVLPPDVVAGRKLFFSATDPRMNNPQLGISCSTCHVEAREDGHVWNTTEGPRNTPSLIGKKLGQTAPFHWNGEFATVADFMIHTTRDRMGGSGPDSATAQQIMAFLESVPTPDNPFTTQTPADVLARGKAAFDKAACGSCHNGTALTDNRFYDVGTYVTAGPVRDRQEFLFHNGLNTPSLLGIARTGPFLHDGSAPTLKARILMGKDANRHGQTSALTPTEVDDLVAYVRSL